MRSKQVLAAVDSRKIMAAARAEAEKNEWKVAIAIVDDGGFPLALERLDGAFPLTARIAIKKAWTAAVMRLPTATLENMVKERPALVTMPDVTRVQGGLPITIGEDCLGAVGVSGATSQQDEQIAAAGIAALATDSRGEP
jgi:glc operon protein GlcG